LVGEIFCAHLDWPCGPPSLLYSSCWVYLLGLSGQCVALTTHPHLVQRLKKE